jgi:ribosomal protein S18 acetylase RimI-like enzyme
MRISPARVGDAEALTDLHLDVWDEAYAGLVAPTILEQRRRERAERVAGWQQMIGDDDTTELLARDTSDGLVGFTCTRTSIPPADDLPALELLALYVRASSYGTGVGHALLTAALGDADAHLRVLEGNERAVHFYQRRGFRFDGAVEESAYGRQLRMVRRAGGQRRHG